VSVADLTAQASDAQRELDEYRSALADVTRQLEQAQVTFKDDPTTGNGKELVKAEGAHKLATLAAQGATERLNAAREALGKAEREQALANLSELDAQSTLAAFETHIAGDVQRALELRAELAQIERRVMGLAAEFTRAREAEVLTLARELRTASPATFRFEAYAKARLSGRSSQAGVSEFVREQREPRNFVADLLQISAKAHERRAEFQAQAARQLENTQL